MDPAPVIKPAAELPPVPLKNSIALKLLRYIFGTYCIVAITITVFQVLAEYQDKRESTLSQMQANLSGFQEAMASGVWNLDLKQLDLMLDGFLKSDLVVGGSIYSPEGRILAQRGLVAPWERGRLPIDLGLGVRGLPGGTYTDSAFWTEAKLYLENGGGRQLVGTAYLYSTPNVVIDRVRNTLIWIVSGAVVKTAALWVIFIFFIRRYLSMPLQKLVSRVKGLPLAEDHTQAEEPPGSGIDELNILHDTLVATDRQIKEMMGQLERINLELTGDHYLLQNAVEFSPLAMGIVDSAGGFLYANARMSELVGYPFEELKEYNLLALMGQRLSAQQLNDLVDAVRREATWRAEFQFTGPRGNRHWLSMSVGPIGATDHQINRFVVIAQDISKIKGLADALVEQGREHTQLLSEFNEVQHQLIQAERMALLGQLAGGVAHEINNPMGFIRSNVQRLQEYLDDLLKLISAYEALPIPENATESVTRLAKLRHKIDLGFIREDVAPLFRETNHGLERVIRIVDDLRAFVGSGEEISEDVNLNDCVHTTVNLVSGQFENRGRLSVDLKEVPRTRLFTAQINLVILNLLVNALQAIENNGEVRIATEGDGTTIWLRVSDNGQGIPAENLGRVFEPFFTTKSDHRATGLGLAIANTIVKKHGGDLTVESTPGGGTTFEMSLPVRPQA